MPMDNVKVGQELCTWHPRSLQTTKGGPEKSPRNHPWGRQMIKKTREKSKKPSIGVKEEGQCRRRRRGGILWISIKLEILSAQSVKALCTTKINRNWLWGNERKDSKNRMQKRAGHSSNSKIAKTWWRGRRSATSSYTIKVQGSKNEEWLRGRCKVIWCHDVWWSLVRHTAGHRLDE